MYMQTVDVSSARAEEADEARWDGLNLGSAEAVISAFNASNGKLLWRYTIPGTAMSFPSALVVGP